MKIKRFEVAGLAQFSYVVSADGRAAVIDPIRDVDRYLEYAEEEGLAITHILETHIHADFASGSSALTDATNAQLALSGYDKGERYEYAMPHRSLCEGDIVEVGSARLQALHTPGHTPEHLSFVALDAESGTAEPVALFSGDFLFAGSLGRPDLLGEDAKSALAQELFRSLHERIAHLPDGVQLYPGHGAGSLCGSGMADRAESTLGYERASNPFFRMEQDEFVAEILESAPPLPNYYPRMKRLNSKGAPAVQVLPGGRALTLDDVRQRSMSEDVALLDLRRPEAFGGAHIAGAINIGAGQNLSLWAGWMLDPEKHIILIAEKGDDEEARRALVRVGLDSVEGYLRGGMAAWIEAGLEIARTNQVSVREACDIKDGQFVLDVRSDKEWDAGHIEGASHIMLGDLPQRLQAIPKDQQILTVCGSGYRSSLAASLLRRHGFMNVLSMAGGMNAWKAQALPLTRK